MQRIALGLLVISLTAPTAWGNDIGLFGSLWDTKDFDDRLGGGALLRFDVNPAFQLDLRASAFSFRHRDREEGVKSTVDVVPVEIAFLVSPLDDPHVQPYVGGGAGHYFIDADVRFMNERIDIEFDDEWGFFALAGIALALTDNVSVFGEAKYTWVEFTEGRVRDFPGVGDFDLEATLDGFGANVGLLFHW